MVPHTGATGLGVGPPGVRCNGLGMNGDRYSPWQILDVGSIWMREFASALAEQVPVVAWQPEMVRAGLGARRVRREQITDPPIEVRRFALQRGYARAPVRWVLRYERRVLRLLLGACADATRSPLICTTPFYAPVAELWPGPVIYYATDLTVGYDGLDPEQVRGLDRRMCRAARAVCPNSRRIAEYFAGDVGCHPEKIAVVPNATRESNVPARALEQPGPLPGDVSNLGRPIAGIIGNMGANIDWVLVRGTMERTPWLHWVFVGPVGKPLPDRAHHDAREWVREHGQFVGSKPYGELQRWARSFDVAVLPYRKKEPTYSGSSTRFYEHLPAGRPMVATRGFAELLEKEPLLELVDTPEQAAAAMERLRATGFRDGWEIARWESSRVGTWQERARMLRRSIGDVDAEARTAEAAPAEEVEAPVSHAPV